MLWCDLPKDEETGLLPERKPKGVLERRKPGRPRRKMKMETVKTTTRSRPWTPLVYWELGKDGDGTKLVKGYYSRWADGASVFAMLAFMTCYVGFFWLCLWDNQCIVHGSKDRHQNDPAILEESYAARSLFWVLCVVGLSSSLRHRRDR